jgi:hypothetical protein
MAGVERYRAEKADCDPKYIKHSAKWLNGRRWEDEPAGANGNGHAEPAEVKDLGDGFIEVDGRRIERQMYHRRYGQAAS